MWTIIFRPKAEKQLFKLDRQVQSQILSYLHKKVAKSQDPTQFAKPLAGKLKRLYRFRVGDYRVVCKIVQSELIVTVVAIGHRKNIYDLSIVEH